MHFSGFLACAFMLMAAPAAAAQGVGYGAFKLDNRTDTEIDFYVDGAFRCRVPERGDCTVEVRAGERYLEAHAADGRETATNDAEVRDNDTATWVIKNYAE